MKIKLDNLGRGYASFWCWLVGPGSVFGTLGAPRLLLLYLRAGLRWGTSSALCSLPHPSGLLPRPSTSHFFNFQKKPLAFRLQPICREVAQHLCPWSRELSAGNPALNLEDESLLITLERAGDGLQRFHRGLCAHLPFLTDRSQAGHFGKRQLLLEAFQEHLRGHHFEGQTAIWVCGAGLNSRLHHKLPPCQLSKDTRVPGVLAGARWHFQVKCSREAVSDPHKSPIQVPKYFSNRAMLSLSPCLGGSPTPLPH